jgi:murein DD-endopeptidase MepM/ murein hydrolase activator NlpD
MQQFLATSLLSGVMLLASSPPVVLAVGTLPPQAPISSQAPSICTLPPASPPQVPQLPTIAARQLPQTQATFPPVPLTNPVNSSIGNPVLATSLDRSNSTVAYQQRMRYPLLKVVPISSNFGIRTHPITGQVKSHAGTDFAADYGTPVVAALSGRVIYIGDHGGYGNVVAIQHSDDTYTFYAHLQDFYTEPGAWVEQGTTIATVGSTGFSTGPHLHFEVRRTHNGQWFAVDPGNYIDLRQS